MSQKNPSLPSDPEAAKVYDMIVIGGGPAGYTAALYAARAGLSVLILEKLTPGGQMALTVQIDNYPGFDEGIDGFSLGEKMKNGALRFGAESKMAEVRAVHLAADPKEIQTSARTYLARTVVLASGAEAKELGLPGEKELLGHGLSHCAVCDGMFFRGKTVAVIGGGNTAVTDALTLARIAEKVILIHRRDTLRASEVYHGALAETDNITFLPDTVVTALLAEPPLPSASGTSADAADNAGTTSSSTAGAADNAGTTSSSTAGASTEAVSDAAAVNPAHPPRLSAIRVRNMQSGAEKILPVDGLFVSIGRKPVTALYKDQLAMDENGYLIADETTKTSLPGVYAVGDLRTKPLRQVVTAAADGAVAAHMAEDYLTQTR